MLQAVNAAGESVIAELVELAEISLPITTMKGSVVNAGYGLRILSITMETLATARLVAIVLSIVTLFAMTVWVNESMFWSLMVRALTVGTGEVRSY